MPNDAYAKFMLRAQIESGTTTVGAGDAKAALAALRDLHDRGIVVVKISDRKGQALGVAGLQRLIELDAWQPS